MTAKRTYVILTELLPKSTVHHFYGVLFSKRTAPGFRVPFVRARKEALILLNTL